MAVAQAEKNWERLQINLAKKNGNDLLRESTQSLFWDRCTFDEYLDTLNPSPLVYKDIQVFTDSIFSGELVFLDRKLLYTAQGPINRYAFPKAIPDLIKGLVIAGVFIKYNKRAIPGKPKAIYLLNGDVEDSVDNGEFPEPSPVGIFNHHTAPDQNPHPICSFNCLVRFYDMDYKLLVKRFQSGELQIVDYTLDESIELSKAELKKFEELGPLEYSTKPPKFGFRLLYQVLDSNQTRWHRSGTVLLRDTVTDAYFLLGQDEGTYFGVELPESAKSVQHAFEVLVPVQIRGKKFARQGEWFVVPVHEREVPTNLDCAIQLGSNESVVGHLPIDSEDSNLHNLYSVDVRVARNNGMIYALKPTLQHDEHVDVTMKGWCTFFRNTALRSFSQQGVD